MYVTSPLRANSILLTHPRIFNVINDIWLVIKWTSADVAESLTKNIHLCSFSISTTYTVHLAPLSFHDKPYIFVDIHHQSNTVTINTLISNLMLSPATLISTLSIFIYLIVDHMTFCLFVLLRLHKDMDYDTNPYYLWGYIAVVAFVPASVSLLII